MITQKQCEAEGHFVLCVSLSILILSQKGPNQITVPDESSYTSTALFRKTKLYTRSSPSFIAKENFILQTATTYVPSVSSHSNSEERSFHFSSSRENKLTPGIRFKCKLTQEISSWEVIPKNHQYSQQLQSGISCTPRRFMKFSSFLHKEFY